MFKGGFLHITSGNMLPNLNMFLRKKFTSIGAFIYPLENRLAIFLESYGNAEFYKKLIEEVFKKFSIRLRVAITCEKTILKVFDRAYYVLRSVEVENVIYEAHNCEIEETAALFIPNYTALDMSFSKYMYVLSEIYKVVSKYEGIIIPYENGSYIVLLPREGLREIRFFRRHLGVNAHIEPYAAVKGAITYFEGVES